MGQKGNPRTETSKSKHKNYLQVILLVCRNNYGKEDTIPRLLYLARISFKIDGEFKSFTDKQKLTECSTTKPALKQMLKELL